MKGSMMDDEKFTALISEIKNWGPSPFAADADEPWPFTFHNEMDTTAGTAMYAGFGKPIPVFLLLTSFRIILYEKQKSGNDRCRSYWHNLDFGDWHWEDPDGFVISGMKTSSIEYEDPNDKNPDPIAKWQTYFVNPSGDKKILEDVEISLKLYHFHQEQRYVMWNEIVQIPGYEVQGNTEYPAAYPYVGKIKLSSDKPGTLDLDALWLLHNDPFEANDTDVGEIPIDSNLHPDKAKRATASKGVSRVSRRTGKKRSTSDKVRKATKKAVQTYSQVKGAVDTAQKVASVVGGGGSAIKGAVDTVKQAAQAAQTAAPGFCGKCGSPLKAGVLFCGNCGQEIVQKVVEKAKDELKGKVEEKIIEKVEKALDDDEKPKGSAKKIPPKPEKAPEAIETPKPEPTKSKKASKPTKGKCPNCNRRVQPSWQFCPDCSQALPVFCKTCGEYLESEWKFCPYCTAELG